MDPFPSNICITEDDTEYAEFLTEYLLLRGCNCSIFNSAEELMRSGNLGSYDFFVLDLGLPGIDGVDLTTLIRGCSAAGILVVSGRLGADAFNSALSAGADMFVLKPVRFDQVTHAISSIWRRFSEPRARTASWTIADDLRQLTSPTQKQVPLSPIEGKLIKKLCENAQLPVTRQDLAVASGIAASTDHRNLDAAFFRLRRKIEQAAGCPPPFRTAHGVGYQLSQSVEAQVKATILR